MLWRTEGLNVADRVSLDKSGARTIEAAALDRSGLEYATIHRIVLINIATRSCTIVTLSTRFQDLRRHGALDLRMKDRVRYIIHLNDHLPSVFDVLR